MYKGIGASAGIGIGKIVKIKKNLITQNSLSKIQKQRKNV